MDFDRRYQRYLQLVNADLNACCEQFLPQTSRVGQAARYSLLAGGKRVRAVLCLAACELLGGRAEDAARFAGAVEMLHCYSLIHDDLPCMDDDDMRRGKPSCHKAFGEATALLAGDLLLTGAFAAIAAAPVSAEARVRAAAALGCGAGGSGMIYGQELDLAHEGRPVDEQTLRRIHNHKTGALINAAVQMGAAAAGAQPADCERLESFAFDLGLVFQIVDDVLDVTGEAEELGKPIGSDAGNEKTTFATLYGAEGAKQLARRLNDDACRALAAAYGERAAFLMAMAQKLLERHT